MYNVNTKAQTFRSFVLKETRHILRDRQTLTVLLMLPVIMVLLFGFAIRTDIEDIRIVIVVGTVRNGRLSEGNNNEQSAPLYKV